MKRSFRVLLACGILLPTVWLVLSWLLTPSLWTVTSTEAVVNARIMTLHSPIEGTVRGAPPPVGKAVAAGSPLLEVENEYVDYSHLEELKIEVASLAERVTALKKQHESLEALKEKLTTRAEHYHAAAVRRLEREVEEAESVAAAYEALTRQREYRKAMYGRLTANHSASELENATAGFSTEVAQNKAAQARAVVKRLRADLEASRRGQFVGPSLGANDVPYSLQRVHEIDIRQQDILAKIQEHTVRIGEVQKQAQIEAARLARKARFLLKAPFDGVVWRRPVAAGGAVTTQTDLLQLFDPSTLFVDALVDEKYFGSIHPGDPVVIRFVGSRTEVAGTVKDVVGRVAIDGDRALAAQVPRVGKHEIHVFVTFADEAATADHFASYHIGRPVEVRFVNGPGMMKRLGDLVSP
jgi:multidrug resistance efflux pump